MREVSAYVTQQFNRYVMGVESLDTFDQFYRQLKEMGIETVLENYQEAYDLMYQNKNQPAFCIRSGSLCFGKIRVFSFRTPTLPPFSELGAGSLALSPFGVHGAGFTLFYKVPPNTQSRYRPASMATGFCTGFFREKEQM